MRLRGASRSAIAGLLCSGLWAMPAIALPIVSIDTDPGSSGVQSSTTVDLNAIFVVDIVISDVQSPSSLNGFEFDLLFDPSVVQALDVVGGTFLLPSVFTIQEIIGGVRVEFAEVSLGPFGATGSGVLASVELRGFAEGTSLLSLENVLLAQPFGIPLPVGEIRGGQASVAQAGTPIPEPTGALLFTAGALVVGMGTRPSTRPRRESSR